MERSPEAKGNTESPSQSVAANFESTDPELARYLNRAYWETRRTEQKQGILRQSPTPSAPPPSESSSLATVDQGMANGLPPSQTEQATVLATPPPPSDPTVVHQHGIAAAGDDAAKFASALKNQVSSPPPYLRLLLRCLWGERRPQKLNFSLYAWVDI